VQPGYGRLGARSAPSLWALSVTRLRAIAITIAAGSFAYVCDPAYAQLPFDPTEFECPPPPTPRPVNLGLEIQFRPTSLNPMWMGITRGWSPSARDLCWSVAARQENAAGVSDVVTLAEPLDCIPVPEPGMAAGLMVGVVFLSSRRRIRSPSA